MHDPFDLPVPQRPRPPLRRDGPAMHPAEHLHGGAQPVFPLAMGPVRRGIERLDERGRLLLDLRKRLRPLARRIPASPLALKLGCDEVLPRFALLDVAGRDVQRVEQPFVGVGDSEMKTEPLSQTRPAGRPYSARAAARSWSTAIVSWYSVAIPARIWRQ